MYSRSKMKRFLGATIITCIFIYTGIQVYYYHISIIGWDASISRNTTEYVFPNVTTTLIKPTDFCESPALLLVVVCSAPKNVIARNAVRKSWGLEKNVSNHTIGLYFLLGKTIDTSIQIDIEEESERYNDIIQEDFIDTYNNLTLKVLMLLKLVKNECRNAISYVMKTDDDMFVNLGNLAKTLLQLNVTKNVIFGALMCHAKPIRDIYDKWYAPKYMYDGKVYPNYVSGTGYVMSVDVTETLFNTAMQTPLFHLEDVYLTGICAKRAKIKPFNNANFNFKRVRFDPCVYQTLITSHYNTPIRIKELYYKCHHFNLTESCKIQKKLISLTRTTVSHRRKTTNRSAIACD